MRVSNIAPFAGVFAAIVLSACGNGGTSPPLTGSPSAPQSIAFSDRGLVAESSATTATVGIRLTSEQSVNNKIYGKLLGYFKGTTSKFSHIVTLTTGQSVVFHNVDAFDPHTASFLGDATKSHAPWPKTFNGSSKQSAAGTDISTVNFSTGTLNAGGTSLTYVADVPGFYMFGCFFHYNSSGMRDIIIVR